MVNLQKATIQWLLGSSLLPYAFIALLTWIFYMQIIKPLLSPLRKIPGTNFKPIIGDIRELLYGDKGELNTNTFSKWLNRYGPVSRCYSLFGKTLIIVHDVDVMKHILVTNCKNYEKPDDAFKKVLKKVLGDGLVTLEGVDHATHKRLMGPSFNNASIKKMITVFEEVGRKLTNIWVEEASMTENCERCKLDVQNDLSHATLDIIGRTAFGYHFNNFDNPNTPVNQAFKNLTEGTVVTWKMTLPYYFNFPFADVQVMKRTIAIVQNKVSEIIANKRKLIKDQSNLEKVTSDILGIMMMAKDETTGMGLSDEELKNEVTTLMGAGHETTSTGMAWFLLAMAEHPEIQAKCQEEVRKFLPTPDTPITMEVLDKLEYLDLVIKETLRMHPPVPGTARQAQQDDVLLGKYHIPAGTTLFLGIKSLMRSEKYFDDPNSFKPERFDVSEEVTNENLYRFLPFLIGPRMCLGYKFALLQMKTLLACFLRQLSFHQIPGMAFRSSYANRITMRPHPPLILHASLYD